MFLVTYFHSLRLCFLIIQVTISYQKLITLVFRSVVLTHWIRSSATPFAYIMDVQCCIPKIHDTHVYTIMHTDAWIYEQYKMCMQHKQWVYDVTACLKSLAISHLLLPKLASCIINVLNKWVVVYQCVLGPKVIRKVYIKICA